MSETPIPTLYEWLGGQAVLDRLTARFYERVNDDAILAPVFAQMHGDHALRFGRRPHALARGCDGRASRLDVEHALPHLDAEHRIELRQTLPRRGGRVRCGRGLQ